MYAIKYKTQKGVLTALGLISNGYFAVLRLLNTGSSHRLTTFTGNTINKLGLGFGIVALVSVKPIIAYKNENSTEKI